MYHRKNYRLFGAYNQDDTVQTQRAAIRVDALDGSDWQNPDNASSDDTI